MPNRTSPREYRYWTSDEEAQLKEMLNQRVSINGIAKILGRSPGSVHGKMQIMGLEAFRVLNRGKKGIRELRSQAFTIDIGVVARFREFCFDRGSPMSPVLEMLMISFMNQVEEGDRVHEYESKEEDAKAVLHGCSQAAE